MRNKYFLIFIFILIISLFGNSCANQVPPTGGPQDTIPPELISIYPEDQSTNVNPNEIILEFNEDIKANKIKEELIISPRIEDYTYSVKRNRLTITINDELDSNTTYTFNFREAVGDLTEDNSPENLFLAFSTGSYIDSLSIEGKIKDLFTGEPSKQVIVGLYIPNDTADFREVKPRYVIESNDSGLYKFTNIKNGKYLLRAIKDQNRNLLLESNSESFAFIPDTLDLDSSLDQVNMDMIKINIQDIKLNNARPDGLNFTANYNKGISIEKIESLNDKQVPPFSLSPNYKKVIFYPDTTMIDSIHTIITVSDSIDNIASDTIWIKHRPSRRGSEEFTIDINSDRKLVLRNTIYSEIISNKPIKNIINDSIKLYLDTVLIDKSKYQINTSLINEYNTVAATTILFNDTSFIYDIIKYDTLNKINRNKVFLNYSNGTFTSIRNDSSQKLNQPFLFPNRDKYAILSGAIENLSSGAIIQLQKNKNIAYEKYVTEDNPEYRFEFVEPGKYTMRIIVDKNNNRRHDIGNILKGILPEPIINNVKEYNLREKWEYNGENFNMDILLKTNSPNVDKG
ncbi:Ig-like domain-containing protein [Mangrovivirga sp. M17]|uniref:Ig-like domain-containing protein n=1 Tax=Mangrovivirga halotolerans TaxID=2993936 RepID=A0ABT3RTY5_9BACT|nr:Ig-like domain-containing protein [Mangrovivirga halotolerans]MCX2744804.1 Ig-like domain-containing protein [Mangrovivirga halotolerans]